jgi:hypothetical protein
MNRTQAVILFSLLAIAVATILCSDYRYFLTDHFSRRIGPDYAIVTSEAAWVPEKKQIAQAKEDVRSFLEEKLNSPTTSDYTKRELRKILSWWPKYRFQVFGKIESGRKIMHLNFMILEERYWKRNQLVRVSDGGAAYWRVDYDIETRTFASLLINGYA